MPSTVFGFVLFLCFITPGLIFEILRERNRPARKYTAFRETGIAIIASVCFSFGAAGVLLLIRQYLHKGCWNPARDLLLAHALPIVRFPSASQCAAWEGKLFPDFDNLAKTPGAYSGTHLVQILFSVIAMVVLATLFAVAVDALLPHREPGLKIRRNSIWYDLLDGSLRPKNAQAVIVAVELKSGGTYYGSIVGYDSEPDQATAWLVLSEHSKIDPPFAFGAIDGTLESIERWQYVFIPFGDIRAMRARFSTEVK